MSPARAIFAAVCIATRALAEPNESPEKLKAAEVAVQAKLGEFAKHPDRVSLLQEAQKVAACLNPRGGKESLSALDEGSLRLQLKVLLAFSAARDPHFDRNDRVNIPTLNVTPPLNRSKGPTAVGMDPKGIADPEDRKAYEDAIAANQRRIEKVNREMDLSRGVDYALVNIWIFVKGGGFPEHSVARKSAFDLVEKTITDPAILARLKSDTMPGLTW